LTFGTFFDQPIGENVLPQNLQSLTFGYYFDQKIEKDVLPQSLQSLVFSGMHPLRNMEWRHLKKGLPTAEPKLDSF
jgi:hypothetical protein